MSVRCKKQYEGKVFKTKNCGDLIVTKYINSTEVYISFLETGYSTVSRMGCIISGNVKDKLLPSVRGVGVIGDEAIKCGGKYTREYKLWQDMLGRCYSQKLHARVPSYADCTTSENFNYFPIFKKWCHSQIGFDSLDDRGRRFQLDKDILIKGNKIYSENTCVFVPQEVNLLLSSCSIKRGETVLGVSFDKNYKKFVSCLNVFGKQVRLGVFDTEFEAFLVYKEAKEKQVGVVANKWKDRIDPRVYEVLINYEVDIND